MRRFIASGFRAAISEQFGLPYLFGSLELSEKFDTGPETDLGADCANFVVYAMRRQGTGIPWSDPKQLREHLDIIARRLRRVPATITGEDLQRGTIVHLARTSQQSWRIDSLSAFSMKTILSHTNFQALRKWSRLGNS